MTIRQVLFAALLPAAPLFAQTPVTIALEDFASGLSGPVDIAHCGDARLFVVEQAGRIKVVEPEGIVRDVPFLDITDRVNAAGNEQGLLGLAFDPNYATNRRFYVNYTAGSGTGETRISSFLVTGDPNVADRGSEEVIYVVRQPYSNHNGGDLAFGPDGFLYVGFGDGGSGNDPGNNGQDLMSSALGDMIRIDVSEGGYTIPPTNPWVDSGDTLPEIWASGLRNPWRFGFDALTGDLWIGDVGQSQREEIDFWPAGDDSGPNFGWRCYEGDIPTPNINDDCPPASEFVAPVSVHSSGPGSGWHSIIGGRVYRGSEFPRLYGRYIYTDYYPTPYFSLHPDGDGGWVRERIGDNGGRGTTCIAENSALELFVTNAELGTIMRIVDQCPMPAPEIALDGDVLVSTSADSYTWYLDGEPIPDSDERTFTPEQSGLYHVVGTFGAECALASEPIQVLGTGMAGGSLPALSVMPIPTSDILMLGNVPTNVARVDVLDMTGRIAVSKAWNNASAGTVDVASLDNAMYILRLVGHSGVTLGQRTVQVQH
ncbi:MAG: PQQ-dependent sugar dehydrogenase [Flavobacteriales bacterium]|nr:PQQ-dependent sugar dehydrogenase [Flavobacteriales bacterium]